MLSDVVWVGKEIGEPPFGAAAKTKTKDNYPQTHIELIMTQKMPITKGFTKATGRLN